MIRFDNVSKSYRIGSAHGGLRTALASLPSILPGRKRPDVPSAELLWALRDVSFRVNKGEALGIIGHNGAGKTTVLKLLSKITEPTSGRIGIEGRVSALIELGAGFHPELSGLDNVYLYSAILGLTRREVDRKLNSIVDFAELHQFMDTPVKRFSSGMYARLAFAVAAHIDPDVLLVDEVLSVGDQGFQQKCFDFIHSFVKGGKTTVFISHNVGVMDQLCDRLVWLDHGAVVQSGEASRVLEGYLDSLAGNTAEEHLEAAVGTFQARNDKFQVLDVRVTGANGVAREAFTSGEDVAVTVEFEADRPLARPHFCVWISDSAAPVPLFGANMLIDGQAPEHIDGRGAVTCVFKNVPLMPRAYYVWLEVYGADRSERLLSWQRLATFQIVDPHLMARIDGLRGAMRFTKAHAPIKVAYDWQLSSGVPPERYEGGLKATEPVAVEQYA